MTDAFKDEIRSRMGGCEKFEQMSGNLEFILPAEEAEAHDVIKPGNSVRDVVMEGPPGRFVGVHMTPPERARSVIEDGFDPDMIGEETVAEIPLRKDAVYAWQFEQSVNISEELWGVTVSAPRESVTVSLLSAAVTVPAKEYVSDFTMPYPEFIRCLKQPNNGLRIYGLPVGAEDLIQDVSDYNP